MLPEDLRARIKEKIADSYMDMINDDTSNVAWDGWKGVNQFNDSELIEEYESNFGFLDDDKLRDEIEAHLAIENIVEDAA